MYGTATTVVLLMHLSTIIVPFQQQISPSESFILCMQEADAFFVTAVRTLQAVRTDAVAVHLGGTDEASRGHLDLSPTIGRTLKSVHPLYQHVDGNEGNEGDDGWVVLEGADEGNQGNEGHEGDEGNEGNEGDEWNEGVV